MLVFTCGCWEEIIIPVLLNENVVHIKLVQNFANTKQGGAALGGGVFNDDE